MFKGGNATLFVADFEASLRFYTEVLGLPLRMRAENYWAEVVAGDDLVIGIHPSNDDHAAPGTVGAIEIGLIVDEPLEKVIERLKPRGVNFKGPIVEDDNGAMRFQYLEDPDGNRIYLWEHAAACAPDGTKA